jgi:CHAD domain-containing protein
MKGKELEKVADKHLRAIEKYCKRIPGAFTIEDIHDLRVDYKRLRTYIRLCKEEAHTRSLAMPETLREIYRAAGEVRDHQLFLAKISLFAKVQYALPGFTQCLQQRLFSKKEELVKKIEKADWGKISKSIESELPSVLHDAAIRQFVNRKVASIHILMLAAEKEEDLHEVRKNLKDLLHGVRIFDNDFLIPFPFPAWKNEKPIHDMAEKLGDFNDECITLSFLESVCQENIVAEERDNINAWRTMQIQQVEAGKKKLLQEILLLDLTAQNAPVK